MPSQIAAMLRLDLAQAQRGGNVERTIAVGVEILTKENLPVIVKTDQATVEGQIEIGGEQQAVEWIKSLGRAGSTPGFDMRGPQQLRYAAVGNCTTAPVGQQIIAVAALADARLDQGVAFGVGEVGFV
ncbi:hypothetical protein PC358_18400 [Pseudomonas capeferrum]|nr:hypothetical protein PC358_18400 [Pseudomonas capeferrum]